MNVWMPIVSFDLVEHSSLFWDISNTSFDNLNTNDFFFFSSNFYPFNFTWTIYLKTLAILDIQDQIYSPLQ